MNDRLRAFLNALHADGARHDAAHTDRVSRRRNLEPDTAELLAFVLRAAACTHVVEIGTSNGYSTLWLADAAADVTGVVDTVDTADATAARHTLQRAEEYRPGLASRVRFHQRDGGSFLAGLADESIDLLFLDADRVEYPRWWPHPVRVLRRGGVLAIDNVLSHAEEVAPVLALLSDEPQIRGASVRVGKGLYLGWRAAQRFAT